MEENVDVPTLPDLKSTFVRRSVPPHIYFSDCRSRLRNGRSETTGMHSQNWIGCDSRRLVCRLFFPYAFLISFFFRTAEGNPGPGKIGAFGVGR